MSREPTQKEEEDASGAPWDDYWRDRAAERLGHADDFGNLVV